MTAPPPTLARQIAEAARVSEHQRTGHGPKSITVILGGNTLVITLHGALSPAETALSGTVQGAMQLQEFHRQLFATTSQFIRHEISRITGVVVGEAISEVANSNGALVGAFATGTVVQVFLLGADVAAEVWTDHPSHNEGTSGGE